MQCVGRVVLLCAEINEGVLCNGTQCCDLSYACQPGGQIGWFETVPTICTDGIMFAFFCYRYVLARMQEGKTDISADKVDYELSSLSAVAITPSAQVLPDIIVRKVGICGRLSYGDIQFKRNSKKVTLTAVDGSGINMHTMADDFNKFCFLVPPGRYRVAPYVSADDKAKGLVVAPTHVDLSVVGEPVHDLQFGQAKLALHGSVSCLDGACPDDVMVLVHVASTGTKVMSGQLGNIPADGHTPPGVSVCLCGGGVWGRRGHAMGAMHVVDSGAVWLLCAACQVRRSLPF